MTGSDQRGFGEGATRKSVSKCAARFAGTRPTRLRRGFLAALCLTLAALALSSAPALALIHRGHVLGFSFEGSGAQQLKEPSGVAVNEATGEAYVVDAGNQRVERFTPNGAGGYEFASEFKVDSPGVIAVDNSTSVSDPSKGDVYVAGTKEPGGEASERDYIYKFTASGEKLFKKDIFKRKEKGDEFEVTLEHISGLAVDTSGTLLAYWEEGGDVSGFSDEAINRLEPAQSRELDVSSKFGCPARPAFAVAPSEEAFYVGYERSNSSEECPGELGEAPDPFAVAKLDGSGNTLSRELDRQSTTGVAVDPKSGDVYLDNVSSVTALTSTGLLIQRFGSAHLSGGSGIAVDSQTGQVFVAGSGEGKVDVFLPEEPGAPIVDGVSSQDLTPSSSELSAQIDPHGVETEYVFQYGTVDCTSAPSSCADVPVPGGKIKAGFGDQSVSVEVAGLQPATAYYYRVLTTNSLGGPVQGLPSPNAFQTLPSPSVLPDGRAWELVSPPQKRGASIEGISTPFKGGITQASVDGHALAWLATGPVTGESEGNRSFELTQLMSVRGSKEWETQSLETPHHNGSGLLSPSPSEYHFFSPDLSLGLVQPTEPTRQIGGAIEQPPLSPEALEKTIYLRDDPPVKPAGGTEQAAYEQAGSEKDRAYLSPGYLPLVSAASDTAGTEFGGALEFLSATPDLNHAVFESRVGLTVSAPSASGLYEWTLGKPLALVSVLPDGTSAPESILGDGEGQNSTGGLNARNAISSDGSRVFWTAGKERLYLRDTGSGETIPLNGAQGHGATEPGEGKQEVPEPESEKQEVHFQSASSDGSKVLFTDTARLTEDSTLVPVGEEGPADLYEFETTSKSGEPLRGRLIDLTADSATASADVLNLIPGSSGDGSVVYFVANGVLAPGATPGQCPRYTQQSEPPVGTTCNLYVSESDPEHPGARQTRFIAALSFEDAADWGAGTSSKLVPSQGNLSSMTSRVSPNGRYLAFMSDKSLTGYDNRNQGGGEQPNEEVYQYDASTNRLLCASCNPNGEGSGWKRPEGVFDTESSGEGVGLLADRPEIWHDRWLAGSVPGWTFNITNVQPSALYQARYLSDNGRLFFDSPDALVPQDKNGKQDVYQYEPQGVGSCESSGGCVGLISSGTSSQESVFLDASENGEDVFFLTAAQLVPADNDKAFDIYDVHVCSEGSPCLTSKVPTKEACESSATCRGSSAPQPQSGGAPPSATFTGPGNVAKGEVLPSKTASDTPKTLTRAQKLARALKTCRNQDKHNKKKRVSCERQARKRYGPKAKAKRAAKAKKTSSSSTTAGMGGR